ncbi:ABC transporter permease [Lipingzhangella sp. LS1_29]|uniref:Transport permease protein n=1 Tax=Lipingzhangella rawalii TaxID=2055835 RepID=A0ABU2H5H2_9ACTN|nr:ABC transporter permease [Lipingzhangella rawalii]MDS1270065.1 ABC transporter permease [Lipingzhangella rawalii]
MTRWTTAVRLGVERGGIEVRHAFTSGQELWNNFFWPVLMLLVLVFMRGSTVPGTDVDLTVMVLPGIVGVFIAMAMLNLAGPISLDREDGTLLRAKATPRGMVGYLVGRILKVAVLTLAGLLAFLVPGVMLVEGLRVGDPSAWLHLLAVFTLGMVAVLPLGAVVGALFANPRNLFVVYMPMMALIAVSGIFYPITELPAWLQGVAQVFPVYWLGLGVRAALLPDQMAAAEIGGSWRQLEMVGVLGVWAAVGLVLAPILMRRMVRGESGARVAARKQQALQGWV